MQMNLAHKSSPEIFPVPDAGEVIFSVSDVDGLPSERGIKKRGNRLGKLASAAYHALPDEGRSLKDTFKQAKADMQNVRDLASAESDESVSKKVTRRDVIKYMAWRYGMATPYQVGDDFVGLPVYLTLREHYGSPVAFAAVQAGSFALAMGLASAERSAQQWKADVQDIDTETYEGPLMDDILDASVNSAPWGVMRHASAEREPDDPIQIVSPARAAAMSASYATVNTGFYAGSTMIPGLNSWGAFAASLLAMYQVKGTIRGYQERMADEHKATDDLAINGIKVVM